MLVVYSPCLAGSAAVNDADAENRSTRHLPPCFPEGCKRSAESDGGGQLGMRRPAHLARPRDDRPGVERGLRIAVTVIP